MYDTCKTAMFRNIAAFKADALYKSDVTVTKPQYIGIGCDFNRGSIGINPGVEDRGYDVYKCDCLIKRVMRWNDGSYKGTNVYAYFYIGNQLYCARQEYRMSIGANDVVIEL